MSNVAIESMRVDVVGHIRLRPATPSRFDDYRFIYRDSSSIRWDETLFELYCLPVKGFSLVDEFRQICAAVSNEYGDLLIFTAETVFQSLPDDLVQQLRRCPWEPGHEIIL